MALRAAAQQPTSALRAAAQQPYELQHSSFTSCSTVALRAAAQQPYELQHSGLRSCSTAALRAAAQQLYELQHSGLTSCSTAAYERFDYEPRKSCSAAVYELQHSSLRATQELQRQQFTSHQLPRLFSANRAARAVRVAPKQLAGFSRTLGVLQRLKSCLPNSLGLQPSKSTELQVQNSTLCLETRPVATT